MFDVKCLWNSWVKKDGVNTNQVLYDCLTLDTPIDFAFGPRLSFGVNEPINCMSLSSFTIFWSDSGSTLKKAVIVTLHKQFRKLSHRIQFFFVLNITFQVR